MSYKLSIDQLKTMKPGSDGVFLTIGKKVEIVGPTGRTVKFGRKDVDEVEIINNGRKEQVPVTRLLGMVVKTDGIVKNEKDEKLRCIDHVNHTLYDLLVAAAEENKKKTVDFPTELMPVDRINKGVQKSMINSADRKKLYETAEYTGGKTFDEAFASVDFVPSLYKNPDGSIRPNATFIVEAPTL